MNRPAVVRLQDLAASPELRGILVEHAYRGIRVQSILRVCLAILVAATVLVVPPEFYRPACELVAAVYLVFSVVAAVVAQRGGEAPVRFLWLALFLDLGAVTALTLLSGLSAVSWSAYVLVHGFFLLPILAATQLRPWLCAAVCSPTVLVYFGVGAVSRAVNGNEPWASVVLRTLVLAAICLGAVLLSRVQRSRVLTVGRLALDRSALVTELVGLEERERRDLSEALHDGALQYVLAARMDLEDLPTSDTVDRLDAALTTAARLLRSTVYELHPAVLEHNGLRPALEELTAAAASRGGFTIRIDATDWPSGLRTDADALLFATARELLTNVARHAGATRVVIALRRLEGRAYLAVTDDGRGVSEEEMNRRLAAGHIGLSSRRARVEAVGGRFAVTAARSGGTVVEVEVPVHPS